MGTATAERKAPPPHALPANRVAFVTAYLDRSHGAFKKTVGELAWSSFAWFAAEPEHLLILHQGKEKAVDSLAQWV